MGAGLLAALLAGLDLRWLFVADAVTCLACAALLRSRLPGRAAGPRRDERPSARPWRDHRLLVLLGLGTAFAIVYLQVLVTLPLTVMAHGLPASTVGLLLTVSAATVVLGQSLLATRWLADLDDPAALAIGHVVLAAGLVLTGTATSLAAYVVATVMWSLGDLRRSVGSTPSSAPSRPSMRAAPTLRRTARAGASRESSLRFSARSFSRRPDRP